MPLRLNLALPVTLRAVPEVELEAASTPAPAEEVACPYTAWFGAEA